MNPSPAKSLVSLSYTAIADFMVASASVQRKTLLDYKYPDEDEPAAKRLYYREARDAIHEYHARGRDASWLEQEADDHSELAALASTTQAQARLNNNARSLLAYARHYPASAHIPAPPFRGKLAIAGVTIRVNPDLHGLERGRPRVVRLDFAREPVDPRLAAIATQLMYEAAIAQGLKLPPSSFVLRHIATKNDYAYARPGSRLVKDIVATCANIAGIWGTL